MATTLTFENAFSQSVTFTIRHITDQAIVTVHTKFGQYREDRATFTLTPDQARQLADGLVKDRLVVVPPAKPVPAQRPLHRGFCPQHGEFPGDEPAPGTNCNGESVNCHKR